MITSAMAECVVKFLEYHKIGFNVVCHDNKCDPLRIIDIFNKYATSNNKTADELTSVEADVLSKFLRRNITAVRIWCGVYEVGDTSIFNALKVMG